MRAFVYRTGLFLALGLILVSCYHYAIYRLLLSNTRHYALDDGITTIVLGDSHTETSIDDQYFPNLRNFSFRGENLYFSYYKLKRILDTNPQIENVLLSFSYYSLNEFHDDVPPVFLLDYYWLLDPEGIKTIDPTLRDADMILKDMSSRFVRWLLSRIERSEFHLLNGGYRKLDTSNLNEASSAKRISGHYFKENSAEAQEQSALQILYFEKFIQLCREKGVRLVFINTPLHHSYYTKIPAEFVSKYYSLVADIQRRHPGTTTLLDLKESVINDELFHDGDHLNSEGGVHFMKILNKRLQGLDTPGGTDHIFTFPETGPGN